MESHTKVKDEYEEFLKFENNLKSSKRAVECKKVEEIFGDLFSCPSDYSFAHCVAEDLSMGKGIAKAFKSQFKEVEQLKGQSKKAGGLAVLEVGQQRYIYYLVTKKSSSAKPTYPSICKSLITLRKHITDNGVTKLAMPRIGCGLDRLEWSTISVMLEYVFKDTAVEIKVYNNREFTDKKGTKVDTKKMEEMKTKKTNKKQSRKH